MKKVGIFVASEQTGFLISLAYQLENLYGFKVSIFARDKYVVNVANSILPNGNNVDIIDRSELSIKNRSVSVIKNAKNIEDNYGIKLSMLLSHDRALGQGYLSNVQKVPNIIRSYWPHKKKIEQLVNDFNQKERLLQDLDLVIQMWPNQIITKVCEKYGVKAFSFTPIKFGDRMFWSDNNFITGSRYIERLQDYLTNVDKKDYKQYPIDKGGDTFNKEARHSYGTAIINSIEIAINDLKKFVKRNNKKDSYHYLGWVPSVFRNVSNYNFVKRNSVKPRDLKNYKTVYFTLHMEPEVALQYFSPEFNNSMEAIIWISKSLPADYILVVKEQLLSYPVRSRWYYEQLIKIPNVVLSYPDIHSWDWIKSSSIVTTITGTVGQEAIHFEKPVISFGKHQIINYLPNVYYVSSYTETNAAIDDILRNPKTKELSNRSKLAFYNAQVDSSIDVPQYNDTYRSNKLHLTMATTALDFLDKEYSGVLSN